MGFLLSLGKPIWVCLWVLYCNFVLWTALRSMDEGRYTNFNDDDDKLSTSHTGCFSKFQSSEQEWRVPHVIAQLIKHESLKVRAVCLSPRLDARFLHCRGWGWIILVVSPNSSILWFYVPSSCWDFQEGTPIAHMTHTRRQEMANGQWGAGPTTVTPNYWLTLSEHWKHPSPTIALHLHPFHSHV